ncbi:MAG: response regulator [Methyloprofundus sp.]|nr:response regulator [Methyloprofundus sp.]
MNSKIENAINRIQALQNSFAQNLAAHINELSQSTLKLDNQLAPNAENNQVLLQSIYDLAHKLAGSAGTFQFSEVYNSAQKLEYFCASLLDTGSPYPASWFTQVQSLLAEVQLASRNKKQLIPQKKTSIDNTINENFSTPVSNKIILVDDDELFTSLIQEQAKRFGYRISCINNPQELSAFLEKNNPEVIVMDIVFPSYSFTGIDLVKQLQAENKIHCPVIFLSSREDFVARLDAVRAGGNAYIVKPVNILELVEILDKQTKSYITTTRALIIADNPVISGYYQALLEAHNYTCRTTTNPLTATTVLIKFRPDIILLDINTPKCNGFEIAEVIRQDNRFTHIPILFLTADSTNEYEVEAIKADGDCFLNKNTSKEKFIASVISLTQRSHKLQALFKRLRKDQLRFQAVSHSTSDAIITLNKEGIIILWNEGAENIFGYQALEVTGQSIEIIIPVQYLDKHRKSFQKLLTKSHRLTKRSIESQAITKDQRLVTIELTYTEWFSGNERFFTSIIRDISYRIKIENELKNQQENLKAIVNNSAEGIIVINEQGIIEMTNPKALEIFSYTAGELQGQNISVLMPQAMRHRHQQYLKHSELHAPKIINQARELQGLRKDNSVFPVELNVSPMSINGEKKYVGILHDITERKDSLTAINRAKHEAESANKAKSKFLSTMSHELRTPLNVILGFTQLLQDDLKESLNSHHRDYLDRIDSSGLHLLNLINDVLDLSTIESGKINLILEEINLIEFINEALELTHPQAHKARIKLENNLPDKETVYIKADSSRLYQIFSNLLTNAIKYNWVNGMVSIWLSQNNNKTRIYIKNTGHGIPEQKFSDLFKPFQRLAADRSEIEGTGIGLTITKMLVELMGGTIGVKNEEGKSCTFWVEWELIVPEEINDNTQTSPAILNDSEYTQQQNSAINILYIEDNPSNRLLMKKIINRRTAFQYNEAETGNEGIQLALRTKPDIILLDINLPDMSGFEVIEYLQKNNISKTTKVIAVSANAMQDDIDKGQEVSFFDYITKPIDQQELLASIHRALNSDNSRT